MDIVQICCGLTANIVCGSQKQLYLKEKSFENKSLVICPYTYSIHLVNMQISMRRDFCNTLVRGGDSDNKCMYVRTLVLSTTLTAAGQKLLHINGGKLCRAVLTRLERGGLKL